MCSSSLPDPDFSSSSCLESKISICIGLALPSSFIKLIERNACANDNPAIPAPIMATLSIGCCRVDLVGISLRVVDLSLVFATRLRRLPILSFRRMEENAIADCTTSPRMTRNVISSHAMVKEE